MSRIAFLTFATIFAIGSAALGGDTPADALMKEYATARTAGLARLDSQYVLKLEELKRKHVQSGDLAGANAIDQAIKTLTPAVAGAEPSPDKPAEPVPDKPLPADAAAVMRERATASQTGLMKLNQIYVGKMQTTKAAALKSGDLPGANAANTQLAELAEEFKALAPSRSADPSGKVKDEFTVEAYIDGNTELHVTRQGLFWKVLGEEAKPGRNDGKNFPCYVSGSRWQPIWKNKSTERGPDTSEVYAFPTSSPNLTAEKVSASEERFGTNDSGRTSITSKSTNVDFVVTIPDPDAGACWYKIKIKSAKR